jgi:CubicO group peptidase (beta-lactamase class C family)
MAKSVTSTLVGAAIADGKIRSVDDPIVAYLPYLEKSPGFHNATIKQILEMATGLRFNEDYLDPKAEVHQLTNALFWGSPSFKDLAISIRSKTAPGTAFEYQSINTEVLGLLLEKVTGEPLNRSLEEKIWKRIGAESDAFLYRAQTQPDQCAFGCLNATLRDYARFGLMVERGGSLGGQRVVSDAWVREATTPAAAFLRPLPPGPKDQAYQGYAYQWWIPYGRDHAFEALGVYGQIIYVNPVRHVVVVQASAWPQPDTDAMWDESQKLIDTIAGSL